MTCQAVTVFKDGHYPCQQQTHTRFCYYHTKVLTGLMEPTKGWTEVQDTDGRKLRRL